MNIWLFLILKSFLEHGPSHNYFVQQSFAMISEYLPKGLVDKNKDIYQTCLYEGG
jgi:hypothetical protein